MVACAWRGYVARSGLATNQPVPSMTSNCIKILSGNANPELAEEICSVLGCELSVASVRSFSDGEIYIQMEENVRGSDVFVVQPTCPPVDRHLMELIFMLDALKRASAERITAVLPYYGYARQDRKDRPRVPISAKVVASMLERAGATACPDGWICTRRRFKASSIFR